MFEVDVVCILLVGMRTIDSTQIYIIILYYLAEYNTLVIY